MFIVYETTCLVNNKTYIGVHNKEGDDYLGSGKLITRAIKRHGKSNFTRQILFTFDTADEAYAKEAELVTEEFVSDPSNYNINVGGFQPPNHKGLHTPSVKKSEANREKWSDPDYKQRVSQRMKEASTRRKPCVIDGVTYKSRTEAANALGLTRSAISWRIKHHQRDYASSLNSLNDDDRSLGSGSL